MEISSICLRFISCISGSKNAQTVIVCSNLYSTMICETVKIDNGEHEFTLIYDSRNHPFKRLDKIFKNFLDTNYHHGRHYFLHDLLPMMQDTAIMFPLSLCYTYDCKKYLGTITPLNMPDLHWYNLKLGNNGLEGLQYVIHDNSQKKWIELPVENTIKHFPWLKEIAKEKFRQIRFYYNITEQKLNVQLYPHILSKDPNLLVSFEPSVPYEFSLFPGGMPY